MTRKILLALALTATPLAAMAMPQVGDVVGTNPTAASKALKEAGCDLKNFEAEDGMIEALCRDSATNQLAAIVIDPKTGAVAAIHNESKE